MGFLPSAVHHTKKFGTVFTSGLIIDIFNFPLETEEKQ